MRAWAPLVVIALSSVTAALVVTRLLVPVLLPGPLPGLEPPPSDPLPEPPPLVAPPTAPSSTDHVAPPVDEPLVTEASSRRVTQSPPPAAEDRPRQARTTSTLQGDFVRVAPGRYRVRRGAVEEALANGGAAGTRANPVVERGRVVGYRLGGVSSDLRRLGLRNGDIITSVNGQPLTSPDAALAAYTRVRGASRIVLALRRGGRRLGLRYDIVE